MDQETQDLIQSFVEEGNELIEDAEQHIESLGSSADSEVVHTVFRLFHSLKGSAGYLNFANIQAVTHEAEALLTIFQKGEAELTPRHSELLIEVIDFLRQLIDAVDQRLSDGELSEDTAPVVRRIQDMARDLVAPDDGPDDAPSDMPLPSSDTAGQAVSSKEDSDVDAKFAEQVRQMFASEAPDGLDRADEYLQQIAPGADCADAINGLAREIHSLKGNAGVLGYDGIVQRSDELETIVRRMADGSVGVTVPTIEMIQEDLDGLRSTVDEHTSSGIALSLPDSASDEDPEDVEGGNLEASASEHDSGDDRRVVDADAAGDVDSAGSTNSSGASAAGGSPAGAANASGQSNGSVRVPTERLDRLFELVGELITAESMVMDSPDLAEVHAPTFRKRSNNLLKLTRELHEVALAVRMIPLQGTFQKMKRLARDVGRRVEKSVDLTIEGGDTEMDKTVIEKMADPLVHIIRNAIDHGLEPPEERRAAGKAETGTVSLSAGYQGKEIVITVSDDGRGLDRDALLSKALERGLVSDITAERSDREVYEMIFEPGFSTRSDVTDVSGRGVGMDVVRSNIESVRGRITIDSQVGQGSTFSMFIPITLAIIDTVTVMVEEQAYSIDLTDVQEFVQLDTVSTERTADNRTLIMLRDRLVPLIDLHSYLPRIGSPSPDTARAIDALRPDETAQDARTGVILSDGDHEFCLAVQEIIGTQQTVVKSLPEYTGVVPGLAGMSIMSNGKVTFILDARILAHQIFAQKRARGAKE
ncbi:MAG TPA: chemotaxis protein CheA [Alkalispirochaeta sp.]|nr:chemotaxis protein CheA [Alkalispirochaeta sp.]